MHCMHQIDDELLFAFRWRRWRRRATASWSVVVIISRGVDIDGDDMSRPGALFGGDGGDDTTAAGADRNSASNSQPIYRDYQAVFNKKHIVRIYNMRV